MKISSESITAIKHAADIVKVVGQYVSLKEKGVNYVAFCPFHEDKIKSFVVNPEHQIYKCFTCGEAGDSVKFVMDIEGVDYGEALRKLAGKFQIKIIYQEINL